MKNDFGYIFNKPFTKITELEEKQAVFNLSDDKLEVKVKGVDLFNTFNRITKFGTLIEKETYYAIDNNWEPITLYNCSILNSNFNAISHSTLKCGMYVIGKNQKETIKHFTDDTKIRKMIYYHDELINIFGNRSVLEKEEFDKRMKALKVSHNAKKVKPIRLCVIKLDNYSISITLNETFSFQTDYNKYEYMMTPKTYISLSFSKGVNFEEVYKIRHRLDSVIHLMTYSKNRNKVLDLICYTKLSYRFNDLTIQNSDKKSISILNDRKDKIDNFAKLFNTMINIDEDESNSFFPFLNYDRTSTSLEIQFLEYYRVLEFMNILSQKKKKKGKNNTFLLPLIKKYSVLKNRYFPNDKEEIIEEEIRNLRNHYSHYGYYIKELRIPTDTKEPLKYLKTITYQWIYDVMMFIKTLAYLELYSISNITVLEKDIMYDIY